MIKNLIIMGLILILITGMGSCGSTTNGYSFNGNGLSEYPNNGTMWANAQTVGTDYTPTYSIETSTYNTDGNTVNYYFSNVVAGYCYADTLHVFTLEKTAGGSWSTLCGGSYTTNFYELSDACTSHISTSENKLGKAYISNIGGWGDSPSYPAEFGNANIRITITSGNVYNISGNTDCMSGNVELYLNSNMIETDEIDSDDYYNFPYLLDGETYKLIFPNAHEYEFMIAGSNIEYDYNACISTTYNFYESCGNLIPDSEGYYIEKIGETVHEANYFHAPSGILTIFESPADNIYISATPFSGQIGWFLNPILNDTTYNLTNPYIAWSLKVIVQNESSGELINDAMVKVDQDCYCTDGYSTRQKLTVNGVADFIDMSLQDASLFVMKSGYKIINENSTGYAAFLSGRANFSSKTWIVKLAPSWSENVSTFYEVNNTVNIYFKDINGNRTSKILDTDSEVYLYYENNNTNDEAMTLRFESSSTHTYFMPEQSWTIAHGDIGHKTIANSYFTPWDYSYRAVIYNSTIYGWNRTIPLTVRNATKETTEHYENLTTYLYFMGASDGRIDYRENMQIGIHACSNNTTLMNVDIELYKNNSLLCYKNMTASDFINADFPYWYMWSPIYDYESGANYSVRMFGFDRTLLETDYVECITDTITRKNKLTIIVKNRFGTNLNNAFVYLEGYGSLPTGINYYASYEGLDNGYYRFKATKPGYEDAGWDDVTMSDGDEIRTYTLTKSTSEAAAANQPIKANDDELRNLYIMLMSFLLIFILFGGFLYVSK